MQARPYLFQQAMQVRASPGQAGGFSLGLWGGGRVGEGPLRWDPRPQPIWKPWTPSVITAPLVLGGPDAEQDTPLSFSAGQRPAHRDQAVLPGAVGPGAG